KLPDAVETAIEAALEEHGERPHGGAVGSVAADAAALDAYADHLVTMFDGGALDGMRIVVDGANGATSSVAPAVLARLGAEVTPINVSPDGCNINDHCGATHPEVVAAAVTEHEADAGLAFDGDGDRVMVVDREGRV